MWFEIEIGSGKARASVSLFLREDGNVNASRFVLYFPVEISRKMVLNVMSVDE